MAEDHQPQGLLASSRLVIIGILVVIIVPALAFVIAAIGRSIVAEPGDAAPVALNNSNACVACHRKTTPGIIEQYSRSSMAAANVTCQNCHEVEAGYPGGVAHHGTYVLNVPTTAKCATCHQNEVAQFNASRHGLPAYVAMWGADGLSDEHLAIYQSIPEGTFNPDRMRNALFEKEDGRSQSSLVAAATISARRQPMARSGNARNAICGTNSVWNRRANRKPATTATSVPIIPSTRSTSSLSMASPI